MEWALPIELSKDGSVLARAAETAKGDMGYVEGSVPSKSPTRIAMKYKGRIYSPLVIESIGQPMTSPVDKNGRYVELAIPMTLCTLTALDRNDWARSGIPVTGEQAMIHFPPLRTRRLTAQLRDKSYWRVDCHCRHAGAS